MTKVTVVAMSNSNNIYTQKKLDIFHALWQLLEKITYTGYMKRMNT